MRECRTLGLVLLLGIPACGRTQGSPAAGAAVRGDSLIAAGETHYAHARFDSARGVWTAALTHARATHNRHLEAQALTGLGLAALRLGDLGRARSQSEEALTIKNTLGPSEDISRSYNALGLIALDEDRNEEAARLFNRAIETARAANDARGIARASGNLANAALYLGDAPRAREGDRLQRRLAHTLADTMLEGNALTNEAMVDIWEGDPRPAFPRLDTARDLYRRIGAESRDERALSQLATAYELTGELDRAFAALDTAVALAHRLGLRDEEAEDLRLLAGLHLGIGDYRRAAEAFDDAESRMRASGFASQRASALRGSADAHFRLGNLRRATTNAEEALRLHREAGERIEQLDDQLLLAQLDYRRSGLAAAEPRLRAGFTLADRLDTRASGIAVALAEARLADLSRNPRRVLRALGGAAADVAAGDYGTEWEWNELAARAWARLGRIDSAVAAGQRAVSAVERLRGALASEDARALYVADRADVYADLVIALLRQGRNEAAFSVADRARSHELLRQLGAARESRPDALTPELLQGEELLRRIDALVRRLREHDRGRRRERGERPDSADVALSSTLAAARSDYETLLIRLAQERPRSAAVLGADSLRLEEVRAALEPGEVLLDFLIASDRLLIFVVTKTDLRTVQAGLDAHALIERVRLLRDLWGSPTPDWRWGLAAARALHRSLLAPVRDAGVLRSARRLLIVPHGILGQVPFAALVDERSGRYVMDDFAITMLPSASALPALRRPGGPGAGWAGAAEGMAPFPDQLLATRQEVAALQASLPHAAISLGPQATERAMRRALASTALVHVATHGVLNVRSPMFSRIELARGEGASSDDDGRLEIHELLGMTIHSPLVFLSGCETGAGQEWTDDPVRGAAELTLAQAMLSAGATNVVLTLWRIDDAGAAAFASRFYDALPRPTVAEALAAAQQSMARDARYASPYYWAGYMLSGSGRLTGPQTEAATSVSIMRGASPHSSDVRRSTP